MRTLLAALTAFMLVATSVVAGDFEDAFAVYKTGDYEKAFQFLKPLVEQGDKWAQFALGVVYEYGQGVPEDDASIEFKITIGYWHATSELT